jgi:DNA-binding winged helix-turn-helix (wHTH) protein/TolB-like protein
MSRQGSQPPPFRLGVALVVPGRRIIERGGTESRIDLKALRVLLALARRPGEVVSKAELFDQVWPEQAVGDDVLPVAVSTLRRALGDDARAPRVIETVPRVGYRLIVSPDPADGPGERGTSRRRPPTAAVLIGAAALLLVGLLTLRSLTPSKRAAAPPPGEAALSSLCVLPVVTAENPRGLRLEAIAAGLQRELAAGLTRNPAFEVIEAPADSDTEDPLAIGRGLGVDAVLVGELRLLDGRLHGTLRLIETASGRHLWANRLDGDPDEAGRFYRQVSGAARKGVEAQLGR